MKKRGGEISMLQNGGGRVEIKLGGGYPNVRLRSVLVLTFALHVSCNTSLCMPIHKYQIHDSQISNYDINMFFNQLG